MSTPLHPASAPTPEQVDGEHHLHPFSDPHKLREDGVRTVVHGDGVWIRDRHGRECLDAMSGLWCVNLGYGRQDLVSAAARQLHALPYYNTFFATTTTPATQLAERLCRLAGPDFAAAFFTCSGSEAIDTVLRIVHRHWALRGQPQRRIVISRHNAYHGSTVAAAALGGMRAMHEQSGPAVADIAHIEQPNQALHGFPDETPLQFGLRAAGWLEHKLEELGPARVAAFIGEPVQGAGGVIIPPASYWPEIERICRRHDVLLIADEVICGFGRLGHWFGHQHPRLRFAPDLITFAKGVTSGYLPLGGVLVGSKVAATLERGGVFEHGFTYSGHPACCAVALATLDAIEHEDLLARVREHTAPQLAQRFATLASHPLVGTCESLGMLAVLTLVRDKHRQLAFDPALRVGQRCREQCTRHGVVMRAVGDRMIVAPPLVIGDADLAIMVDRIRASLDSTHAELRRTEPH